MNCLFYLVVSDQTDTEAVCPRLIFSGGAEPLPYNLPINCFGIRVGVGDRGGSE